MKITPKRKDARKAALEAAQQARGESRELQSIHDFFMNPRWSPVGGYRFERARVAKFQTDKYGNRIRNV